MRWLARVACGLAMLLGADSTLARDPTFAIDYVIRIDDEHPDHAHVRWNLAGIGEIQSFRLVFRDDRTTRVRGTGDLDWAGSQLTWTPGGPYAHLRYDVRIDRRRPSTGPRFDSHAAPGWVVTRALHLFPEINVTFRPGAERATSRARLIAQLPPGWDAATALTPLGPSMWHVDEPGKQFDRPRGWFAFGRLTRATQTIAGSAFTIVTVPGSTLDVGAAFARYARIVPQLATLLGPPPPRLLLVSAPDPMWRGGISGEDSFFVNTRIPLVSNDHTSTYVHELFHTWQPFPPRGDGRWVTEALAEYYALVVPHRAGLVSDRDLGRGLRSFRRSGRWGLDVSQSRDPRVLNNTGPAIVHWLDREIRRRSNQVHSLDDVVRALAASGAPVTTAAFLRAVNAAAGHDLSGPFRRHVFRGERPPDDMAHRLAGTGPLR